MKKNWQMNRFTKKHILAKNRGDKIRVRYARPLESNDNKRWGRELSISTDSFSIRLNGAGINSLKSVLRKAGEIA